MATGETISTTLSGAMPTVIKQARPIREYEGTYNRTTTKHTVGAGEGGTFNEFQISQVDAQDITETTVMNNPQQFAGTLLSSTPQMSQIMIKVTDRTYHRIAKVVSTKLGGLAGMAMKRKRDEDYLSLAATFATTVSPGSGNPLSFGHISAGVANAENNVTEGATSTIHTVLHGFGIKDLQDEILAGVGTYNVTPGMTETTYRKGFQGSVAGSNVWRDNNIAIDATPNANGLLHAQEGVYQIQGMTYKVKERYDPAYGGGAQEVFITDEYSFLENTSSGTQVFCYLLKHDATAPAS
jgi:hypothetical protein